MNEQRSREFVSFARRVAEEEAAWADWHNRVFGTEGKFQELFPTPTEREAFVTSQYQRDIDEISASLREGKTIAEYTQPVTTASGKFVVRLPSSLHEALTKEARAEGVSLNQLVVSKLSITLRVATQQLLDETGSKLCQN